MASTLRWYANRGEVVSWKDIPQDAKGIVEWWRRLGEIWGVGTPAGPIDSLALLGPARLTELAAKYHAEYAIVQLLPNEVRLPLKSAYENNSYAVYRFRRRRDNSRYLLELESGKSVYVAGVSESPAASALPLTRGKPGCQAGS